MNALVLVNIPHSPAEIRNKHGENIAITSVFKRGSAGSFSLRELTNPPNKEVITQGDCLARLGWLLAKCK